MKTKDEKPKVGTPVRDDLDTKELEEVKEVEVKKEPVKTKTVYNVKCIWSGPVRILAENTPSGTGYSFQPGQIQQVASKADQMYIVNLGLDKPGCCSGSGTPRMYFELA